MYSTQEKDKRESFAVKISFIPNTLFFNWNTKTGIEIILG